MAKGKLTEKQRHLLDWVNKVDEPGTYQNKVGYFYCECDNRGFKPFNVRTVFSLIERGLVELRNDVGCSTNYSPYGVYALRPIKKNIHG